VSKIALRVEGRGRWTSALGFSWSTHRVMGGCADTWCRSSAAGADERLRARRGEKARRWEGELSHGRTTIALTCAASGECCAHARAASDGSGDDAAPGGCTEEVMSER